MPLTKLQFRPGINKETTSYSNEGGWYECDKVRFRFGVPEKIGGWEHTFDANFLGTCRSLIGWTALDGNNSLAYFGWQIRKSISQTTQSVQLCDTAPLTQSNPPQEYRFRRVQSFLADFNLSDG